MKVHEEEADLVDLPAEVLAGQPVGKFVKCGDDKNCEPDPEDRVDPEQAAGVLRDLIPVHDGKAGCEQDQGSGACEEIGGKEELDVADETVEEAIGVEETDPEI